MKSSLLVGSALLGTTSADMYLQSPRGSNNRLDDENRDRNNGNRLFDSQNNNRGGYNVGQMYYYTGSEIPMQWSVQHSCGNPNNNCEMIVQYMCDDRLRDGTTTTTIPINPKDCYDFDCDSDVRYGRHESFDFYKSCMYRSRNKGLFTSTEKLKGNGAIYTRQNPNGNRRGYECPEERDYYPYWHPTPWKDVLIMTNQPQRCEAYAKQSQNVARKYYCDLPNSYIKMMKYAKGVIPITQMECERVTFTDEQGETHTGNWRYQESWGIDAPECMENAWSRDNHHGNIEGGSWTGFNWTTPDYIHEQCAIRIRYNISTNDMPHFDGDATLNTASLDSGNNTMKGKNYANFDLAKTYGLNMTRDMKRGYVIKENPQVDMFGSLLTPKSDGSPRVKLQLAIDTSQYGRTFQDRTHKFAIRKAPVEGKIHNLNVRGKRGNIVQTYPAHEYDFVPNRLHCRQGDYVHFQWTGSNTNPNNNAGQGRQGSDRHNVVPLREPNYMEKGLSSKNVHGHFGNSYPARIDQVPFLGFTRQDMQHLAILDTEGGQFGGELSELDDAGTYFDLGPRKCEQEGIFHYLCTRNNNFSNRSQKGKIVVNNEEFVSKAAGYAGAHVKDSSGNAVLIAPDTLNGLQHVSVSTNPDDGVKMEAASALVTVSPAVFNMKSSAKVSVTVQYETDAFGLASLYRSASGKEGTFEEVDEYDCADGFCTTETNLGGTYMVQTATAWGIILPTFIVISVVLFFGGKFGYKKLQDRNLRAFNRAQQGAI